MQPQQNQTPQDDLQHTSPSLQDAPLQNSQPPQPAAIPQVVTPTQPQPKRQKLFLRSLISFVVFVAAVFILASLINSFVFQSYYVDGTSMNPTLQNSDRLIIDKVSKSWSQLTGHTYIPNRGQIIILDSQLRDNTTGGYEQLIKRVIGLPGEHILIKDGTVTISNAAVPTGFDVNKSLGLKLADTYSSEPIDLTIPNDSIFVMGDNRAPGGSLDSRSFGPVGLSNVEGRLWARVLPVNTMQFFK